MLTVLFIEFYFFILRLADVVGELGTVDGGFFIDVGGI